ncbi:MAG TPA: ATP-binding protein [bacterium]|nr:ATP-binding protein [bacterium]
MYNKANSLNLVWQILVGREKMLIEFSFSNYLSFKDKVTLSMIASNDDTLPQNVVKNAQGTDLNLLKSAVIYGANASGKSNFIKAMTFMKYFVEKSYMTLDKDTSINSSPFKLDQAYFQKPSEFEVVFLREGIRYIYGFKIDKKNVLQEWFYHYPKGQQSLLFERTSNTGDIKRDYKFGNSFKGGKKSLAEKTKRNSLFISVAAQFNHEIADIVVSWFSEYFKVVDYDHPLIKEQHSTIEKAVSNEESKNRIVEFLKVSDTGIEDISIDYEKLDDGIKVSDFLQNCDNSTEVIIGQRVHHSPNILKISILHKGKNAGGESSLIPLKLGEESAGTKKLFDISETWINSIDSGSLMIVDEFDLRLHPLLSENLVNMFNSDSINKNNAQLIITTHNSDLLDKNIFRRDQVWFTEKSRETGSSSLYSIWDFKKNKARKTENLRKNYLAGRYGAVPILSRFED